MFMKQFFIVNYEETRVFRIDYKIKKLSRARCSRYYSYFWGMSKIWQNKIFCYYKKY